MIDIDTWLDSRAAMPSCSVCGAVNCGNITCRACRQATREVNQKRGWSVAWLDRLDEIDPELVMPVGAEEVKRFMERLETE